MSVVVVVIVVMVFLLSLRFRCTANLFILINFAYFSNVMVRTVHKQICGMLEYSRKS